MNTLDVLKSNGNIHPYDEFKLYQSITRAMRASTPQYCDRHTACIVAGQVTKFLQGKGHEDKQIEVNYIRFVLRGYLITHELFSTLKAYDNYNKVTGGI